MEGLKSMVNIGNVNISDLKEYAKQAVNEISERAGKKGQFLNTKKLYLYVRLKG